MTGDQQAQRCDDTFIVDLTCRHCYREKRYSYPKGTELWRTYWRFRSSILKRTRCGYCGVVGGLDE